MTTGQKFIWLDGDLVEAADANVHVSTYALHYGIGFFEGIRAHSTSRGPAIFRLGDHIRRLQRSAAIYHLQLPYSEQELSRACHQVVTANGLSDCYLRPLVFLGRSTFCLYLLHFNTFLLIRSTRLMDRLHLGALDTDKGEYVMLGKTFKGLTDATLEWQTQALLARETHRDQWTVYVRPELVVEIAFSDLQASPRYPGGLALRLARVKRYRSDKSAEEADTLESVRRIYAAQAGSSA